MTDRPPTVCRSGAAESARERHPAPRTDGTRGSVSGPCVEPGGDTNSSSRSGWPVVGTATLANGDELRVVRESIAVGGLPSGAIEIERPEDPPSLLQEWCDLADPSIPIPYWAEIWPSSRGLARLIASGPSLAGRRVLDLGCGLGLSGIAAGLRGAAVTFVDSHPDALLFARRNAGAAGLDQTEFLEADWRDANWARPFDLVLGADILYERSECEPVAKLLGLLLEEGGVAWIGDPCRPGAATFVAEWSARPGCRGRSLVLEPMPGEETAVAVHQLRCR